MPTVQISTSVTHMSEPAWAEFAQVAEAFGFDLKASISLPVVRQADEKYSINHMLEADRRVEAMLRRDLQILKGADINIGSVMLNYDDNHYRDGVEADSFPAEVSRAFGASMIPYSPAETELVSRMMLSIKLLLEDLRQGEDISYGFEGLAQCNRRYPAYDDHVDAGRCMGHANYLNDMAGVNTQFVDILTTDCENAAEVYAWTVQAMSWQRGMANPEIDVIPVLSMIPVAGDFHPRDVRTAQAQALHDMGHDDFILWGVRNDDLERFVEAMADYAKGFNINVSQESDPELFDKPADDA